MIGRRITPNCREDPCGPCTGCECECHDVPAPDLRELAGLAKPDPDDPPVIPERSTT